MYKVTKKVRSYEKGTKLLRVRNYEKVRSYKKEQLRKRVQSYEKVTKRLRNKLRKTLVTKLPGYEIVTPRIVIIYYEV
jgi:hypothetical protein